MTETVGWIALGLVGGLYVLAHFWGVGLLLRRSRYPLASTPETWPRIAILVPARNEEAHLGRTLDALLAQDYPSELMEIIVGDDRSTDRTRAIALAHGVHVADILGDLPGQRGKQNVLAILVRHVQPGTVFCLVTDADILLPPTWAKTVVRGFTDSQTALVSGPTVVDAPGLFAKLQGFDWRYGVGAFQAFAEAGFPITAVGNNMAFRLAHYRAIGGYEALPFSITEDYRLYQAFRAAGYGTRFLFQPEAANRSAPIRGLRTFLHQRKRWYKGGMEAPLYARSIYYLQAFAAAAWVASGFWLGWQAWVAGFAVKLLADGALLAASVRRLRLKTAWWLLPLWELYFALSLVVLPLYFILPQRVVWKGRHY